MAEQSLCATLLDQFGCTLGLIKVSAAPAAAAAAVAVVTVTSKATD